MEVPATVALAGRRLVCAVLAVSASVAACTDDDYASPDVYVPQFDHPSSVTLTKGVPATFELTLNDTVDAHGVILPQNDSVTVVPKLFDLTSKSPTETFTITAALDGTGLNESSVMTFYIGGAICCLSPGARLIVIDPNTPQIVTDKSSITMAKLTSTTLNVQLSKPPVSTLAVELRVGTLVEVTPSLLTFSANDYNTPQVVTVASHMANVIGGDAIILTSPGVPSAEVDVTVN